MANSPFRTKHSLAKRIWHWGTFVTISGSLLTVLLAKTLLNSKTNIPVVQDVLQKKGVTVNPDQAKAVTHEYSDMAWHWHIYLGYILAGLFAFRILYEFFQPKDQKVIPVLKKAIAALRMPGNDKKDAKHYLLVKYLYLFFYFALLVQTCTGLFMAYSDDIDNLQKIRHTMSDIHSVFMWVIISYIVLHLGGVLLAELNKRHKGVVSDMINGNKE
jgi:Ni/Fe-hydrogenase 1 B-type cytochrome subunit